MFYEFHIPLGLMVCRIAALPGWRQQKTLVVGEEEGGGGGGGQSKPRRRSGHINYGPRNLFNLRLPPSFASDSSWQGETEEKEREERGWGGEGRLDSIIFSFSSLLPFCLPWKERQKSILVIRYKKSFVLHTQYCSHPSIVASI